jgi:hypothetical protein
MRRPSALFRYTKSALSARRPRFVRERAKRILMTANTKDAYPPEAAFNHAG